MDKLKPCPSCGCSNYFVACHILTKRLPWWWHMECGNCHWCGKTKLFRFRAVRAWNRRAE